jgi:hypothetical protein
VSDPTSIYKGFIWACRSGLVSLVYSIYLLLLFRVEDLAAAVAEVPELPPMELLM